MLIVARLALQSRKSTFKIQILTRPCSLTTKHQQEYSWLSHTAMASLNTLREARGLEVLAVFGPILKALLRTL